MAKSDPTNKNVYRQQSVVLGPADTPGVTIERMLSVIGFDDAPPDEDHITFKTLGIHKSTMILGDGRGFEVVQGRLGPGRIHHAIRSIGAVSPCLHLLTLKYRSNKEITGRKSPRIFPRPHERPL